MEVQKRSSQILLPRNQKKELIFNDIKLLSDSWISIKCQKFSFNRIDWFGTQLLYFVNCDILLCLASYIYNAFGKDKNVDLFSFLELSHISFDHKNHGYMHEQQETCMRIFCVQSGVCVYNCFLFSLYLTLYLFRNFIKQLTR